MGPAILAGLQSILSPALEATYWTGDQAHSEQLSSLLTARSSYDSRGTHPGPTCGMFPKCHGPCDLGNCKEKNHLLGGDSVLGGELRSGSKRRSWEALSLVSRKACRGKAKVLGGGDDSGLRLVYPTIPQPAGGKATWPGPRLPPSLLIFQGPSPSSELR